MPDLAQAHRWGLPEALLGFGIGLVLSALAVAATEQVTGAHPGAGAALPVGLTAADVGGLWVGLVGAALYASKRYGTGNVASDYGLRWGKWWDLPLGAAVGLAAQYGLVPLLYLPLRSAVPHLARQLSRPAVHEVAAARGPGAMVALFALLAIGAPLVEELFFRGLLLRALLGRASAPVAIVVSALLFGVAHFEPLQFAGLAAFGVVLGLLAWSTSRLAPGIAAHAAFNAAAVASLARFH